MKTKHRYDSGCGHRLLLPKDNQANALFLEFVRDEQARQRELGIKTPLFFSIKNDSRVDNDGYSEYYVIEFNRASGSTYADAAEYINANMPAYA